MTSIETCLHNYIHVAPEGIVICSPNKKILFMNEPARNIFGLKESWSSDPSCPHDFSSFFYSPEMQETVFHDVMEFGSCEFPCVLASNSSSKKICLEIKGVKSSNEHLIFTINDRTKFEIEKKKYHEQSIRDCDTGLYNKRYFNALLHETICHATKKTLGVGLLLFDIDKFKNINDTYGHWVADMIISQLARRIDKSIRKSDIFARVGGDEFAILAMNIQQKDDLITTSGKIFKELEKPFNTPQGDVFISISVGGALYPSQCSSVDELKKKADNALYNSKDKDGCYLSI